MWLAFKNSYNKRVRVAVMQHDTDACGEYGNWATEGWWKFDPGNSRSVIWTPNRYVYYYAEATDGRYWGDKDGPKIYINPYENFESCYKIGTTSWDVVRVQQVNLWRIQ